MKLNLLFGSGVSIFSELPGTSDITKKVLTGEYVYRDFNDENYYINNKTTESDIYIVRIKKFIEFISKHIDEYYIQKKLKHNANYEDIYYIIQQIYDSEYVEFDNPAISDLTLKINSEFKDIINNEPFQNLGKFCKETLNYIKCIVWHELNKSPKSLKQFDVLKNFIEIQKHEGLDILTLNHDTLIEQYLKSQNIGFSDGFNYIKDYKLPVWRDYFNSQKVNLYKLHGSIDWFFVYDKELIINIFKVPKEQYIFDIYNLDSRLTHPDTGLPEILVGTFNKMMNYLSGIHEIYYDKLKSVLNETEVLLVSGYSFNDKGINSKIIDWLKKDFAKELIIIHPIPDDLYKYARGSFSINIKNSFYENPKLKIIKSKFEDLTLDDLKTIIYGS